MEDEIGMTWKVKLYNGELRDEFGDNCVAKLDTSVADTSFGEFAERAINSHDDLVAAINEAINQLTSSPAYDPKDIIDDLADALAKAEGR